MRFGPDVSVNDVFNAMSEGERCHMANKLYKEGYEPIKMRQKLDKALEATGYSVSNIQLTDDEMVHVWRRLNVNDYQFENAGSWNKHSQYPTQPAGTNGYTIWHKFDEALRNG